MRWAILMKIRLTQPGITLATGFRTLPLKLGEQL
jgi:hypothetical protein